MKESVFVESPTFQCFSLRRDLQEGLYHLPEVVQGLEKSPAVQAIFPDSHELSEVLGRAMVRIRLGPGYMRVDNIDGTIIVAQDHLRFSDKKVVYLDFVHELVHIKQVAEGRTIYGREVRYVDKDTELEAYGVVIKEGRRIGMTENELRDYLEVPWITEEEYKVLLRRLGISPKT